MIRLNKYIAQAGVCSRRKADELIKAGKVKVNGLAAQDLGLVIDENNAAVEIAGKKLETETQKIYLALNKPRGYITSSSGSQGKSVLDLIKIKQRIYPVGRLDKDSRGLLILTNDGDFAYRLTQAKFGHEKEYEVELDRALAKTDAQKIERGLILDGKKLQPVRIIKQRGNRLTLILKEGVNRQIRRMAEQLDYKVEDLKRIRIGKLKLADLKEGECKKITPEEV
ncbi:MAG: pseudouridine synthase [Patescibacteria group bacterium]|jgi:pseudouridine synthase